MNKELKKAIEAELASLISAALTVRNKKAAAEVSKTIKDHAKSIAKKFVKNLPKKATVVKTVKKVTKVSRVAAKPLIAGKTAGRIKRTLVKK